MKLHIFCIPLLVSLLLPPFALAQQKETGLIEVRSVRFNQRAGASGDTSVVISITPKNGETSPSGRRYVNDITLTLYLGYEIRFQGETSFKYFRSSIAFTALETSINRDIAFWLPEDIVERDGLSRDPKYWVVEVKINGKLIDIDKSNYRRRTSSALTQLITRNGNTAFTNFVREASSGPKGILRPTYLTDNEEVDRRGAPAYIREK